MSKADMAKYPFMEGTKKFVGEFKINEFAESDYDCVVERAVERIKESIRQNKDVFKGEIKDAASEILSFPIAMIITKKAEESYLQKRFALIEAKKISLNLEQEKEEKIIEIAREGFNWKIATANLNHLDRFRLHFTDYLRNASVLHAEEWKLVNKTLSKGDVYLTKKEVVRLLQEEVRHHIEEVFESTVLPKLPDKLNEKVDEVRRIFFDEHKRMESAEEITGGVEVKAFPPCMLNLYLDLKKGKNIPHTGRFTLTAFLINIGMSIEDLVKLYTSATDFDERMTKYQVEHIAGLTGGRTKYKPLSCGGMKTHSLCQDPDQMCPKVRNPLVYYKKKNRILMREMVGKEWKQSSSFKRDLESTT